MQLKATLILFLPVAALSQEWVIAPNLYNDRPMYECDAQCIADSDRGRTISGARSETELLGRCEGPLEPPYTSRSNQWQFHTNSDGVRGLTLCKFTEPAGPDPIGPADPLSEVIPQLLLDTAADARISRGKYNPAVFYLAIDGEAGKSCFAARVDQATDPIEAMQPGQIVNLADLLALYSLDWQPVPEAWADVYQAQCYGTPADIDAMIEPACPHTPSIGYSDPQCSDTIPALGWVYNTALGFVEAVVPEAWGVPDTVEIVCCADSGKELVIETFTEAPYRMDYDFSDVYGDARSLTANVEAERTGLRSSTTFAIPVPALAPPVVEPPTVELFEATISWIIATDGPAPASTRIYTSPAGELLADIPVPGSELVIDVPAGQHCFYGTHVGLTGLESEFSEIACKDFVGPPSSGDPVVVPYVGFVSSNQYPDGINNFANFGNLFVDGQYTIPKGNNLISENYAQFSLAGSYSALSVQIDAEDTELDGNYTVELQLSMDGGATFVGNVITVLDNTNFGPRGKMTFDSGWGVAFDDLSSLTIRYRIAADSYPGEIRTHSMLVTATP